MDVGGGRAEGGRRVGGWRAAYLCGRPKEEDTVQMEDEGGGTVLVEHATLEGRPGDARAL